MARKKFHLSWFTNFALDEWLDPLSSAGGSPWSGDFYVDMAKSLERACFDYIILEDTLMLSEAYGGSSRHYLKNGMQVPKHDPAPLAAVMGAQTSHLGIVATLSTLGYHPFSPGAPVRHHRPHQQGQVRLEHRHQRRGRSGAEFRTRQAAAA
jgi:hypothetical protein